MRFFDIVRHFCLFRIFSSILNAAFLTRTKSTPVPITDTHCINHTLYINPSLLVSSSLMDKAIDVSKKFAKTAGKKILKETAKATGDLIGNKIADKITSASKKSHDEVNNEILKERYISPKDR